jgi:hypothetical protein
MPRFKNNKYFLRIKENQEYISGLIKLMANFTLVLRWISKYG